MQRTLKVRAVFERRDGWTIAYIPEIPGVNAQERTRHAARRSLQLALQELLELDPAAVKGTRRHIEELTVPLRGSCA